MKVRMCLAPLQFNDTGEQKTEDIEDLFGLAVDRRWAWIFGTESGPGSGVIGKELLRVGDLNNYRMWIPSKTDKGVKQFSDCWIAVRQDLITGGWKRGFKLAIPGSEQLRDKMDIPKGKRWAPKGLAHVAFDCEKLGGRISLGAAHYITDARDPESPYWDLNKDLADVIDRWGQEASAGIDLAWYGGDQNMADQRNDQPQGDTFMGGNFLSAGDELKKWANTGHGPIDVIARRRNDRRVSALDVHVYNDRKFFQHSDHYVSEATYRVDSPKR